MFFYSMANSFLYRFFQMIIVVGFKFIALTHDYDFS